MVHIILLILKIIGMALLIILGILLLLLIVILFVPIRYRAYVEHGEQLQVKGTVSWMLHIIHTRITLMEAKLHIRIRIFGILIYDNLRIRVPKTKKARKSKIVKGKRVRGHDDINLNKHKNKIAPDFKKDIKLEKDPEKIKSDTIFDKTETDEIIREQNEFNNGQDKITGEQNGIYKKLDELPFTNEVPFEKTEEGYEHITLLKKIIFRIRKLKEKIIAFFRGWKDKIKLWFESAVNLKRKVGIIFSFIRDELNREAFKLTYSSLIKLLKHILPTKLKSRIVFGTGDPCSTGQALGAFGILYSIYGDKIQIIPDFENMRFEGKHDIRGRIRLVTILIIVIKLILDKRFKRLRANMKILKEAL